MPLSVQGLLSIVLGHGYPELTLDKRALITTTILADGWDGPLEPDDIDWFWPDAEEIEL